MSTPDTLSQEFDQYAADLDRMKTTIHGFVSSYGHALGEPLTSEACVFLATMDSLLVGLRDKTALENINLDHIVTLTNTVESVISKAVDMIDRLTKWEKDRVASFRTESEKTAQPA